MIRIRCDSTKLRASGFTLIELLVVVTIIVVLISLLLPRSDHVKRIDAYNGKMDILPDSSDRRADWSLTVPPQHQ